MNPNLELAIIEFIANEFHLPSDTLSPETHFTQDLKLTTEEISDLLARLQDALNFTLPDDKASDIETLGDLFAALTPEKASPPIDEFI